MMVYNANNNLKPNSINGKQSLKLLGIGGSHKRQAARRLSVNKLGFETVTGE